MAFYVLSISNAMTTVCRVLPNWLGDKFGAINLLVPCTLGTTIVALCWEKTYTLGGLTGISFGWSFASGALISLPPLGIADLTKEPLEYGRRIGLGYTVAAFGALLGDPTAGAVLALHRIHQTYPRYSANCEGYGSLLEERPQSRLSFYWLCAVVYWG